MKIYEKEEPDKIMLIELTKSELEELDQQLDEIDKKDSDLIETDSVLCNLWNQI